ncbi:MAG: hypothetical protein WC276_09140 [Sedimentibacter sp.]
MKEIYNVNKNNDSCMLFIFCSIHSRLVDKKVGKTIVKANLN